MEKLIITTASELNTAIQNAVQSQIINIVNSITARKLQEVMTIKQASDFLGLSVSTIYSYVNKRQIPYSKRNGSLFFLRDSILSWLQEGERKTFSQLTR